MLIEIIAGLNCVAFVVLSLLAVKYTNLVAQSKERPWPGSEDQEAWEKERLYRWGLERRRVGYTLAAGLGCWLLSVVLGGPLESFWLHGWFRHSTVAFVTVGMWMLTWWTTFKSPLSERFDSHTADVVHRGRLARR